MVISVKDVEPRLRKMEEIEKIEGLRRSLCFDCPFVKIKKDCVNCYSTHILSTRKRAFRYAVDVKGIPEDDARLLFKGGETL